MMKFIDGVPVLGMTLLQNVTSNAAIASGKRSVGRKRKYSSDAERVAAWRVRKNIRAVTFDLSEDVLQKLFEFMERRVDSANPSETKSQVVERALNSFFRKR